MSDLVLFQPWHSPLSKRGEKVFDSWQVVVVHLLVIVVDYLKFVRYVVVDVHIIVVHSDLVALYSPGGSCSREASAAALASRPPSG